MIIRPRRKIRYILNTSFVDVETNPELTIEEREQINNEIHRDNYNVILSALNNEEKNINRQNNESNQETPIDTR